MPESTTPMTTSGRPVLTSHERSTLAPVTPNSSCGSRSLARVRGVHFCGLLSPYRAQAVFEEYFQALQADQLVQN